MKLAKAGAFATAVFMLRCGGATPEPRTPDEPARRPTASEEPAPRATEPTEPAPRPSCTDEGCFTCGNGYCPTGFYCDESASGGAACSWLPECGRKGGCDCVGRALAGSRCEPSGSGAHVR